MFWFQVKTKSGYVRIEYLINTIIDIKLNTSPQKRDKNYKVYNRLKNDLLKYFSGRKIDFKRYKINIDGLTDFERNVLENTRLIPYGNTKSYSQIASEAGNPRAGRAAGNALNKNPVPIIIPCHRVIKKTGKPGGFSAGEKWKKILLLLENP
ncbi:MAG: methylated-DNA--[protein]-cysteine S-methyltransferase [bacterium]